MPATGGGNTTDADAELALRLRAEVLIGGFDRIDVAEAIGALADVESVASALAVAGLVTPEVASAVVADTVDALAVRGASWVEASAVDLDVRRLYELAAGAPRSRLRRVVPVARGSLTSIDLWDDRAEARLVAGDGSVAPSLALDAVSDGDVRLELHDGAGGTVAVDLTTGRPAAEGGSTRRVDAREYLARLEVYAAAAAWRDPSVEHLNALRRRLSAVGEALGDPAAADRFDASLVRLGVGQADGRFGSRLVEVVPVALRTPFGWLLSIERWTDHWRAVVRSDGSGLWTAVDDTGLGFGGEPWGGDVLRFDPALAPTWSWVTISRVGADGTVVDVDVVRQ